ncbi:transposase [Breznakia pachnodae]|uniref:transposase n=1 Tax=Breznakia pachnodae TaxID=265178 RepID=UPI00352216DD
MVRLHLKNAKVCIDSFHVIVQVNKMLKNARIRIMKSYHKNSKQHYLLKNLSWLLMMRNNVIENNYPNKYNHKLRRCISCLQLLNKLKLCVKLT